MQLELKLEFERQCLHTGKWEYEGEFKQNVYPYSSSTKIVNFKQLDRDDYSILTLNSKFIIYIAEKNGDTKVEITRLFM